MKSVAAEVVVQEVGDIEGYLQALPQDHEGTRILLFGLQEAKNCQLVAAQVDRRVLTESSFEDGLLTLNLSQIQSVNLPLARALERASYGACAHKLLSFDTPVNRFAGAIGKPAGTVMVRRVNPITGRYITAPVSGWGFFFR